MTSDKSYSTEQRLDAIIGLIYNDGTNQESIGTAAQGVDLQLYDLASGAPPAPTQGTKLYSNAGALHQVQEDGNDYACGRNTQWLTVNVTVTTAAPSYTTLFTWPVAATTYRVVGKLTWLGAQNAGSAQFIWNGPSASHVRIGCNQFALSATTTVSPEDVLALAANTTQLIGLSTTTSIVLEFTGLITFTAGGTFTMGAAEHTGGDSFTVGAYSFMDLLH